MPSGSIPLALLACAETLRISAPTVVGALLGKVPRAVCDERLDAWSRRLIREAAIDLRIEGRDRIPAGETFVVMSNHQSLYDVPVLFQSLPRSLRMVAKTELFRIPVFAQALTAAEFIEIDRKNKERSRASIELAKERLRSGIHVWIAPEGTRSTTGRLGPFKKGGFILALDTATRILPVTVDGTLDVMPPHGLGVRRGARVVVTVHDPIDPRDYGSDRRDALVDDVRRAIASALSNP